MTQTLGDLTDRGEPEFLQQYRKDLPVRQQDVCRAQPPEKSGEAEWHHRCTRWQTHVGAHADISPNGLVLAVWENVKDPEAPMGPEKRLLFEQLNGIADDVHWTISQALSDLRDLQSKAQSLGEHNTELLAAIKHTFGLVRSMESDACELGAEERDWA
jgi:hypothetical protein